MYPSVGDDADANARFCIRPAKKALRPARTASRIASAIKHSSLAYVKDGFKTTCLAVNIKRLGGS